MPDHLTGSAGTFSSAITSNYQPAVQIVLATLTLAPEPRVEKRVTLFDAADYSGATPHANYDVSPDGQYLVMVRPGKATGLTYLQNVPALVRRNGGHE